MPFQINNQNHVLNPGGVRRYRNMVLADSTDPTPGTLADKIDGVTITLSGTKKLIVSSTPGDYKVKADSGDAAPGYLDSKVENVTLEVSPSDKLRLKETWDDSMSPAFSVGQGASAPTFLASIFSSGNIRAYGFDGGTTMEQIYFSIQIPHRYKQGSNLRFHVHWMPSSANAGDVVWQMEFAVAKIGGTFGAPSIIETTPVAAGGTAWVHKLSSVSADISGTGLEISSILVGRLFRDPAHTSDTYADDAVYLGCDLHFVQDTQGSLTETSKV